MTQPVISHCDCVYYQDWHRTSPVRPPPPASFKPGVHRLPLAPQPADAHRRSIFDEKRSSGQGSTVDIKSDGLGSGRTLKGLPFDEEAKLVYGVLISLRSMVKRLSGRCVMSAWSYVMWLMIYRAAMMNLLHLTRHLNTNCISLRHQLGTSSFFSPTQRLILCGSFCDSSIWGPS